MLKINLLPVRQLKKRAKAKQHIFMMAVLFVLALVLCAFIGFVQTQNINSLNDNIAKLQKEKDSYTPTLAKISKLKKDKLELDRKTGIIKRLKSDSSLTVRVLDEVANKVDNQRMWLESLNQQGASLTLSGVALDNQTIAQFMDSLKQSPVVREVSLENSSMKVVSGRNLKSFQLTCNIAPEESKQPESKEKTN